MGDGLLARLVALAALAACLAVPFACGGDAKPSTVEGESHWVVAEAADEGFDPAKLAEADRYAARNVPNMTSLLVARHGRLVLERYYHGTTAGEQTHVFSVTKSVLSALVGIALREGKLRSVDQRLADFVSIPAGADPQFRSVTLRDLLTMTAGLELGPEAGFTGGGSYTVASNWVRDILAQPFAHEPGATFTYDNRAPHLLSAVLTKATGMPAAELAQRELFEPLGIGDGWVWTTDPQGVTNGSWGLSVTARDLAKLGHLYLRHGRWDGEQVVPADYVRASTRRQVGVGYPGEGYGYLWWTSDPPRRHSRMFAMGLGGQFVVVYPALDLVVVTTSGGSTQPGPEYEELIDRRVIAAVRD